ncbi:MAG TPA: hypothetical protein VF549_15615 [Solirubrobacteraceae bacterium]
MSPLSPAAASTRHDIQGLVLTGYGHMPHACYVLLRVAEARPARDWLAQRAPQILTAAPWSKKDGKPRTALNVAFTWTGLQALGLPQETLSSFPHEFAYGMAERAMILHDFGRSDPKHWEFGNDEQPVDGLLLLYATSRERLDELVAAQRAELGPGLVEVGLEFGRRPASLTEHFGFKDGVSQPRVGPLNARGKPEEDVVQPGAFVLGHTDEYGVLPPTPAVRGQDDPEGVLPPFPGESGYRDLGRNGTYLVYRKLEQDVAGFWRFLADRAGGDDAAVIKLASKFIGRWPSGSSLVLSPDRDDPHSGRPASNDFGYLEHDLGGHRCPIGSHVRRANPRDALSGLPQREALKTTNRHRILRRGIPYGEPLFPPEQLLAGRAPLDVEDDGSPRGLHFIALNASISSQFEMVSEEWATNASFQGLYDSQDPILGNDEHPGSVVIEGAPARRVISPVPSFVTARGGGYFFMPSMTAVRFLSAL